MGFKVTIRELRERSGVSQQDVADAIGVARATYASLEAGRRDPSLGEMTKLAEYYQIAPSDLIDESAGFVSEPVVPYAFAKKPQVDKLPDTNISFEPGKLRQILLYVLGEIGAKPNVGEAVLCKLLYFIDFDYFEKTGRPITGLTYIRNHYGPVPASDFTGVVEGMKVNDELEVLETESFKNTQKKYLPLISPDLTLLTADELRHINKTLYRLSDKSADQLSELSRCDAPWLAAQNGEPIQYSYVLYRAKGGVATAIGKTLNST